MNTQSLNPTHWRLSTLLSLGTEHVHDLARVATGSLTTLRLIVGRCLLALRESKGFKEFGCSSEIHYAMQILGLPKHEATACRRVARELLALPELSLAAEFGKIEWSKLREIVRKATQETESYWMELARQFNSREIQALVARTPEGSIPGEVAEEEELATTELRCPVCPRVFRMLAEARRLYSIEQEEVVTNAAILEMALAAYIAGRDVDADVLEKARREADKDIQAQDARRLPLVQEARDLAEKMGLLGEVEPSILESEKTPDLQEMLADALGVQNPEDCAMEQQWACDDGVKKPTWVEISHSTCSPNVPNVLELSDQTPANKRLKINPNKRFLTKAQRKEVLRRDGWCCQTPGCPHRCFLELHHIKSYSEGGKTIPANLLTLCGSCHANLHAGDLQISFDPQGKLVFTNRKGERLDRLADLEMAHWLDLWHGWRGGPDNSHQIRAHQGSWSVF